MTQITIKYDQRSFVFDKISRNALCSDLLSQLEVRLGSKIPENANLTKNGRFLRMHESIEEVSLVSVLRLNSRNVL